MGGSPSTKFTPPLPSSAKKKTTHRHHHRHCHCHCRRTRSHHHHLLPPLLHCSKLGLDPRFPDLHNQAQHLYQKDVLEAQRHPTVINLWRRRGVPRLTNRRVRNFNFSHNLLLPPLYLEKFFIHIPSMFMHLLRILTTHVEASKKILEQ